MPLISVRAGGVALGFAAALAMPGDAFAQVEADSRGLADAVPATPPSCAHDSIGCITLLGVSIDGVTAFSLADLAPHYEPYLARAVSTEDLARIAQAITDHYRAAGYFLSTAVVPPQDASGIARISIIEGRIGEMLIEGDGAAAVAPYFRGVDAAPIADIRDLERRLALAGDAPGVRLSARMAPLLQDSRAHRLIITTELTPIEAYATLDNHGADAAGPWQLYGRAAANSLMREGDQAAISVFTTPAAPSELSLGEASYTVVFVNGGRLRISVSASRAQDGADMSSTEIGGDGTAFSFAYEYPILRHRRGGLWLGAALDAQHQVNDWSNGGGYADELRVARVALRGRLSESGRATTMFVQASFGLPVLGASGASPARRSRADADAEFAKLDFYFSGYRDLGDHFGLYGALAGQWSAEPLLSAEEFAVGGTAFGRGYGYGEISGDRGLAALLELRVGHRPESEVFSFVQGYVFFDAAETWNVEAQDASLASVGVGLRVSIDDRFTAGVELVRPLSRTPPDEGDKDWRQFFSVSASY